MNRLLRAEFKKLFWTKTLWICCLVSAILALVTVGTFWLLDILYGGEFIGTEIQSGPYADMLGNMFSADFSGLYFLAATNTGNSLVLLVAVLAPIFITGDFAGGSVKNAIARGFDRTEWYLSKLVVSAIAACLVSFAGTLIATLAGTVIWGFGRIDMSGFFALTMSLVAQLAVILAMTSIFICFSVLFRTTGAAVAVCIISVMSLSLVLTVIDLLAGWNFSLAKFELSTMLASVSAPSPASGDIIRATVASAVYLAASCTIGIVVFRKRDI